MQLRLSLTYRCVQELGVCAPSVHEDDIKDHDRAHADGDVITINDAFGPANVVPDVDRYRLHLDNRQIALQCHSNCQVARHLNHYNDLTAVSTEDRNKTIVIVLESPHEDEYECNVGQPIAPAQGSTGCNIQRWLDEVLRSCSALHHELREGTRVLLSNPVQFQASLASIIDCSRKDKDGDMVWKKVRDAVWKALWCVQPIRDEFRNRLEIYRPDFVINACTHDLGCNFKCLDATSSGCRKRKVHDFLLGEFCSAHIYYTNHPSSWRYGDRNWTLRPSQRSDNRS